MSESDSGSEVRVALKRTQRAATVDLARRVMAGETVTPDDAKALLPDADDATLASVVAMAQDSAEAARRYVEEAGGEIAGGVSPDRARQIAGEVYQTGRLRGVVEAQARETIKQRAQAERDAEQAGVPPLAAHFDPASAVEEIRRLTEAEGERRGYKADSPEWRVLYRKALAGFLSQRAHELDPSATRAAIEAEIGTLNRPGSRVETSEKRARAILSRVETATECSSATDGAADEGIAFSGTCAEIENGTTPNWKPRTHELISLVAALMLLWALWPGNPYGYFLALRVVAFAAFALLAFTAHSVGRVGVAWMLGITAAIYNPFVRIHLAREVWSVLNVGGAMLIVAAVAIIRRRAGRN